MPAGLQGRVELRLLSVQTQLLQAFGFNPTRVPLLELDQGAPLPQRESLIERMGGAIGFAQSQQLLPTVDETLETVGVDLLHRDGQPVAIR
ncbi:MAG TPA: hypothetical protein VK923_02360 [Euzebyales bacterium]|nr:hypothetical protein [Euzebyales bacterium]